MKTLIVFGEQGLGDELMGGTLFPQAINDYEIAFDCHPRLEWLHRNSVWAKELELQGREVRIVPTRKNRGEPSERPIGVKADAKSAILDLCRIYRQDASQFVWNGPTYCAPADEAAEYGAKIRQLAQGRKIIGLATRGGTISTNTRYRRLPGAQIERLLSREDCLFIGLDYEDMSELVATQKHGNYIWPAAINFHWDYQHVAGLIAATDLVLSVPQSVMHLSAGMGHQTRILCPSKPDWRMGQTGEVWNWYAGNHCRIIRQKGEDWGAVVDEAFASIDALDAKAEAA